MSVTLCAILLLFIGHPIAARYDLIGVRYLLDLVFMLVLLTALNAETGGISWKRPDIYAVLLAVVLRFGGTAWQGDLGSVGFRTYLALSELYIGCLLLQICYRMLSTVIRRPRVTTDVVAGVAAVYVLLAVAFASFHIAIFVAEDQASAYGGGGIEWNDDEGVGSVASEWGPKFTYYSVVTQTTLGYGDITPRSAIARGFTMVQTIVGQLFLAVVLAQIVAIKLTQQRLDDDPE